MASEADLLLALRMATAAGEAIRPLFRSGIGIEDKDDSTPVTVADRGAEMAMRHLIASAFPDDGIIGEEFGAERTDSKRIWILDPIDGTSSFIAGRPTFGTLIALVQDGWPVLGVIDQPISGERWVGRVGEPTLFNGEGARTRPCATLAQMVMATTSPHQFDADQSEHFMALARKVAHRRIIYGGDCYNYGLLASGHIDLVVEAGLAVHDYAALVPVVEGAGGLICDWNGDPLNAQSDGTVIALGDPARLDDVLEAMGGHDH
jgi:inositol-phosphate phosphatase/L-galactose 1-phosphate phosphatase/histidinol-phosphatase